MGEYTLCCVTLMDVAAVYSVAINIIINISFIFYIL